MKYKVTVLFTAIGEVEVEASSKEEAFNLANDESNEAITLESVKDLNYIEGSWRADKDGEIEEVEEFQRFIEEVVIPFFNSSFESFIYYTMGHRFIKECDLRREGDFYINVLEAMKEEVNNDIHTELERELKSFPSYEDIFHLTLVEETLDRGWEKYLINFSLKEE